MEQITGAIDLLSGLTEIYRETYNDPPKQNIPKNKYTEISLPKTPMKYMTQWHKNSLINQILEDGLTPSKIWIYPAEHGEIDNVRNTLVIVGIDPETYNPEKDYSLSYSVAIVNGLYGEDCGRITAYATWESTLDEAQESLNLPIYAPDWEAGQILPNRTLLRITHLSFYPSPISDEHIVLGIFAEDENDIRYWKCTNNWDRLAHFDPEVDIDTIKCCIEGIKKELYDPNRQRLDNYTKHFVNCLRWDEVKRFDTINIDKALDLEIMGWLPFG